MSGKDKPKGYPLHSVPLMTLLPVTGALGGNRIYRADEHPPAPANALLLPEGAPILSPGPIPQALGVDLSRVAPFPPGRPAGIIAELPPRLPNALADLSVVAVAGPGPEAAVDVVLRPGDVSPIRDEPHPAGILYYLALSPAELTALLEGLRGTAPAAEPMTGAQLRLLQDLISLPERNDGDTIDWQGAGSAYSIHRGDNPRAATAELSAPTPADDSAPDPDTVNPERAAALRPPVITGDGYADPIVGAEGGAGGGYAGEAYPVARASSLGSLDATGRRVIDLTHLAAGDGFIIQGDAVYDSAGISVSGAGDVNGDGYADLIVGARRGDDGGNYAGEAYVVFGKEDDFGRLDSTNRRVIDLTSLAAGDGFIIQGDEAGDRTGISVSGAGDVNGDGFADLIVGAGYGDDGGYNAGEAYVVFGKEGGFGSLDADTNRRVIDLTSLAAGDGFIIQADEANGRAGEGVSGAGDVNGDGFADLIVGARGGDDGGDHAGEAYVVFGKQDGFGNDVSNTLEDGTTMVVRRVIDLSSLPPEDGFIIQGDRPGDQVGSNVSGAGDVNGDGFADLIVGARLGDDGGGAAGEAYVVFGKEDDFGGLDRTNRRVIDLSSLAVGDGFIIQGDTRGDYTGWNVSGAGDVNGDGYADLIVGAGGGDDGGDRAGEAYVVFGKASGFGSEVIDTSVYGEGTFPRHVIDLTELAPEDGFIIQGDEADDYAGGSGVSGAGDVNGDGYADLIVGAIYGGNDAGEAYVVFGKEDDFGRLDGTNRRVIDLTSLAPEDGFIIQGDRFVDWAGVSVSGAGDVNSDGYADLIVGAPRGDDGGNYAGEAYVLFGGPAGLATEAAAVLGTDGDDVLNADGTATVVLASAGNDLLNIDGFTTTDLLKFDAGTGTDTLRLNGANLHLDLSTLPDTRLSSIERIDLNGGGLSGGHNSLRLSRLDLLNLSEVRDQGRATLRVDGEIGDRISTSDEAWIARAPQTLDDTVYAVFDKGNARLLVNTAISYDGILTYEFHNLFDLTDLAPEDGFIIRGDRAGDSAGVSVSGAGDVNGDGYADLLVGAHQGDDAGPLAGEAYLVFGKTSGLGGGVETTPEDGGTVVTRQVLDLSALAEADGVIIRGDAVGDLAGVSVSGAGDVNGDGYADLLVGAVAGDDGGTYAGEAYLIFGSASGIGHSDGIGREIDLSDLDADDGVIIQGDAEGDFAGRSVSGAGDVNGDGYADLLIGAVAGDDGGESAGEAYLVFGKGSGFGSPDDTGRRVVDLTGLAPADGFIIQGAAAGDFTGISVSGAGDVNGDGYADLIVGAYRGDDGGESAGAAYLVFGRASGMGRVLDLSRLAEADGVIIHGDRSGDRAGISVSGAGDVNGDGYADLIVGSYRGDYVGESAGAAYLVFGKASGIGRRDGTGRVLDLSRLAEADGMIIRGDGPGDRAGLSVSGAGDVNGDGYADLLVGAPLGDDGGTDAGAAYLVFGKASGTGRVLDLSDLDGADGFTIQGDEAGDRAGYSISGAGDVNGDGYADLIVGAPRGDDGGGEAGEAYVLFGGSFGLGGLSTEEEAVLGTDGDDLLNGNGQTRVMLAGAGDDVLTLDGTANLLKFDGGSGTDTLSLANPDVGTGLDLDLSRLADTRLSSIERIDLSGNADNSLSLTRLDLLNLSEVRTEGRAELRVDGNTGDSVTAPDDGWARSADVMIEGTMYRAFDNGNARLLVNMDVSLGGNLMATSMATVAEALQNCCVTQTVDIRAFIEDLPPEDEEQQRKRLEDELAMLGPLPAAKVAMDLTEPVAVASPDADLFDLPPLIPDDG